MRIKQIAAKGLKGAGFRHDLAPITFIIGDNGSGKTAVTDAIKIALLGKHPVLGATNAAIFQLCQGDSLEIEMGLEGLGKGHQTKWQMIWKKAGSRIQTKHSISDDQKKMLLGLTGACLDFREFSQAKPTERQRLLETVMGEQEDQRQPIAERVAALGSFAKDAMGAWDVSTFSAYETLCAEAKKQVGQDVKRLKGALEQSAVDEATAMMVEHEAPVEEKDLTDLEIQISQLDNRIGSQEKVVTDITEAQMRAPERPQVDEPTEEGIKAMEARVTANFAKVESGARIAQHNAPIHEKIRQVQESMKKVEGFGDAEKPSEPLPDLEELKNLAITMTQDRQQAINEQAVKERAVIELKSQRDRLKSAGCCPTCGTKGDDLEAAIVLFFDGKIETAGSALKTFTTLVETCSTALEEGKRRVDEAQELTLRWEAWNKKNEYLELSKKFDELEKSLQKTEETEDNAALQRELETMKQAKRDWEQYQSETVTVPTQEKAQIEIATLEKIRETKEGLQLNLKGLKEKAHQYTDAIARVRTQTRHQEELDTAVIGEQELATEAGWAKGESMKATAEALKPLLEPANRIINGVVEGQLSIEGTRVGLQRDGFHPLEVLSGAEAATVAIAVQTALSAKSPIPIIIADELSALRPERKRTLVANLREVVSRGDIEQAILIDHDESIADEANSSEEIVIAK